MSEDIEPPATPEPPIHGKAGRNEGRKLAAAFCNSVGVAFFLAAVLQPFLAVVGQGQAMTLAVFVSSFLLAAASAISVFAAQAIVRKLED